MSNYLGERGYTIFKSNLTIEEQINLREELTVKPYMPKTIMVKLDSFPIYRESNKKFYIPKFFGIENFGFPEKISINEGDDINIKFNGDLRDHQKPIVKTFMNSIDKNNGCGGGLIDLACGQGKCHGINTPIIMFDGKIKMIQDIEIGDKIMGDDSTSRDVLSLARGKEMMYDIIQSNGDKYTVNESHILSLKCTESFDKYIKNEIYDISLLEYIDLSKKFIDRTIPLKGYKRHIDFETKELYIEPYSMGYWLCSNDLVSSIPFIYKINNRDNRLKLLAGIIDYCAFVLNNGYTILLKKESLINDITFLSRTLGLYVTKTIINPSDDTIYKIYISGNNLNLLPIKNERKKINFYHYRDLSLTDIEIKQVGIDNYYGFELNGNHRYLLGDTTVTHNTVLALNIISEVKKKTLIIVHKSFLLNQWIERINEFLPEARIGQIQGQIIDIENKDIVIGMLQSLSMKEYPGDLFRSFGFTVIDECHHISSEVFSRSLQNIVTRKTLGLSATMQRKDGLTKVFKMFLGDIIYRGERKEEHDVLVKGIEYKVNDEEFNNVVTDFRGNPAYSTMISKLCSYNRRSEFIMDVIINELNINPNQQIMILGQFKNILVYLYKAIESRNIASVGYYLGGMKEKDLKLSENKKIVIATYAMAAEGLDIKTLTTLIMVTPKTDITQSVGRILRVKHENPLIIDIIDSHDLFKRQWNKRKSFYEKKNYKIIYTTNKDYKNNEWQNVSDKKNKNKNKKNKLEQEDGTEEINKIIGKCLLVN